MLAVEREGGDAGGARIHAQLERVAKREASLPAIYITLARLERKGYLRSRIAAGAATGGRQRRLFTVTRAGAAALQRSRDALERMWRAPAREDA
jgi:DNA-binding PadR family transcriptional regulator